LAERLPVIDTLFFVGRQPTFISVDKDQQIEQLTSINKQQSAQLAQLRFELDELKRLLFGRKSERFIPDASLDPAQLDLAGMMQQLATAPPPVEQEVVTKKKATNPQPTGRLALPDHLERVTIYLEPEQDITGYRKVDEEWTEQLDYVPGKLLVRRYVRPKYAKDSADATSTDFIIAPLPAFTIEKGMAAPGLLAQIIVDKHVDHLPVYRQIKRYQRDGVKLAASTICGWLEATATLLAPLNEELKKQIIASGYIQADETPLPVLNGETKGATQTGYLWAYHSPPLQLVYYDYQPGRSKKGPLGWLSNFSGYLQTDGYGVYDHASIGGRSDITQLYCMAHARRYFEKALVTDKEPAQYFLTELQKLYAIERKLREQQSSPEQIVSIRQQEAVPILAALKTWLTEQYTTNLVKSPLTTAVGYALQRWDKLSNYTTNSQLQIDNNLVENAMRPVALGRKNYLFAGSNEGGKRLALFYSLLETCKKHELNPLEYIHDILERMPSTKTSELRSLLPDQWKPRTLNS
jgi:transposase